MFILVIKQ